MIFREAYVTDIPQLNEIRLSVKENALSNPLLVTYDDYVNYLTTNGKGWLCEADGKVLGFSIIDTTNQNIWALFVRPGFEGNGIARKLQRLMLDWHFKKNITTLWLSTAPGTRAEKFYEKSGWINTGFLKNGEIKFEMMIERWLNSNENLMPE